MTEAAWNASSDPQELLDFLRNQVPVTERKVRLIAIACCRRMWRLLADERSRKAVEITEEFVDGKIHQEKRKSAAAAAWEAAGPANPLVTTGAAHAAAVAAARVADRDWPLFAPFQPPGERAGDCAWHAVRDSGFLLDRSERCSLIRDIFGPLPFRPVAMEAAWRTPEVGALAHAVYEQRDFGRLPELAEALVGAGCRDAEIVGHCSP